MTFSVLMAVYEKDNPAHLEQALNSLRIQTLKASEVVLVEDGPISDELAAVIERYRSQLAIKSVKLAENKGLAAALNEGLKYCVNDLIARMDSDDISLPERFQAQVAFMMSNPDVAVSGAWIEEYEDDMVHIVDVRRVPAGHEDIFRFAKRRNPINHPVSIFRKSAVLSVGGYPNILKAQDYALWALMLVKGYRFANIPKVLLKMRTGVSLMKRRGFGYYRQEVSILRFQRRCGFLGRTDYVFNLVARAFVRLQPSFIKLLMYRYLRRVRNRYGICVGGREAMKL